MDPGAASPIELRPTGRARVPPVVVAAVAQLAGWVVANALIAVFASPTWVFVLGCGALAAGAGRLMRMASWWTPVNATFPLAVWIASRWTVSPLWFLGAFVVLAVIYGTTFRTQVPLYLSNGRAIAAVAELLPRARRFRFLDVGCGTGTVLAALGASHAEGEFHGLELAPGPWLVARVRGWLSRGRFTVARRDLFREPFADYDVVYAFLSPVPMPDLWRKARAEMRPGTIFVSNTFAVPGVPAHATVHVGPGERCLHVWRM